MALPTMRLGYSARPDWYTTSADHMTAISHIPGTLYQPEAYRRPKHVLIHRTHLVVLESMFDLVFDTPRAAGYAPHAPSPVAGVTLRHHQEEAIAFIAGRRGSLLAMEMRTGKTLCPIFAHDPESGPLMVIAPLAVREVWLDWMRRRWPDVEPLVVTGTTWEPARFAGAALIFVHYEVVAKHVSLGFKPGTLVLDEVHLLSNHNAQRTKTMQMFGSLSRRVVALTGTPLWNKPAGLWPILTACNPAAWGSRFEFCERYAGPERTPYGTKFVGSSNEAELDARLAEVMFARTWRQVAPYLPPVVRAVEIVPIDTKTRLELDLLALIARGDVADALGIGEVARLRKLLGLTKVAAGREVARQLQRDGLDVVVWVHHHAVARAFVDKGAERTYVVTGEQSAAERVLIMRAWKLDPAPAILVISLAVGQVGIDLSKAHHAVFIEADFTPAVMAQAEARTFSPERPMSSLYLAADHEVDRMLVDALVSKTETARTFGLPAPDAMDVFASVFDTIPKEEGDLDRLLQAFLSMPDALDD